MSSSCRAFARSCSLIFVLFTTTCTQSPARDFRAEETSITLQSDLKLSDEILAFAIFDLGEIEVGSAVRFRGRMTNRTGRVLNAAKAEASCTCIDVKLQKGLWDPDSDREIEILFEAKPSQAGSLENSETISLDSSTSRNAGCDFPETQVNIVLKYRLKRLLRFTQRVFDVAEEDFGGTKIPYLFSNDLDPSVFFFEQLTGPKCVIKSHANSSTDGSKRIVEISILEPPTAGETKIASFRVVDFTAGIEDTASVRFQVDTPIRLVPSFIILRAKDDEDIFVGTATLLCSSKDSHTEKSTFDHINSHISVGAKGFDGEISINPTWITPSVCRIKLNVEVSSESSIPPSNQNTLGVWTVTHPEHGQITFKTKLRFPSSLSPR